MSLLDSLLGEQNSGSLMQLAERFGLNNEQVQNVVGQLAPALSSGIANHTEQNGLSSLLGMLQSGNHQQYAQDSALLQQQAVDTGNGILGHLFGSKDISRHVAETTSRTTGVNSDIIKKMLPLVAIMAMNALYKKTQQKNTQSFQTAQPASGLLGDLTNFLGGGQHQSIAGDVLGMLRRSV